MYKPTGLERTLAEQFADAYRGSRGFVTALHGVKPHEVRESPELADAVLTEALASLRCRVRGLAEQLAEHLAPRGCQRRGCRNEATYFPATGEAFCSRSCRAGEVREGRRVRGVSAAGGARVPAAA